mgnify:CR=1 FL=1
MSVEPETSDTEVEEERNRIRQWKIFMTGVKSNEELGYPAPQNVVKEVYSIIFFAGGTISATQLKR